MCDIVIGIAAIVASGFAIAIAIAEAWMIREMLKAPKAKDGSANDDS